MKKTLIALAALAVLGGSAVALANHAGAIAETTAACGPCDPGGCMPCPGCPCK
jgi:hypothetical protein